MSNLHKYKICPACNLNPIVIEKELCDGCAEIRYMPTIPISRELAELLPEKPVEEESFEQACQRVWNVLKDFQRATVDWATSLLMGNTKRILIADEVGLGKTLVARGVIAQLALNHKATKNAEAKPFTVVYVCSNAGIARQNIEKLKICKDNSIKIDNTRLSMQHLVLAREKHDKHKSDLFLIPITPSTSVQMNGRSTVAERALMYAVLQTHSSFEPLFTAYPQRVEQLFKRNTQGWESWAKKYYIEEVQNLGSQYLTPLHQKVSQALSQTNTLQLFIQSLTNINLQPSVLKELRSIFATISVQSLKPDLVIMDEFQRFKSLLTTEENSTFQILRNHLFGNQTKIMLLSATPYKMYSTLSEVDNNAQLSPEQRTDHFSEFRIVLDFLLNDSQKTKRFLNDWQRYASLVAQAVTCIDNREYHMQQAVLAKQTVENVLRSCIARTERLPDVSQSASFNAIEPTQEDAESYLELSRVLKMLNSNLKVRIEFIKSSPYPLSYMRDYKTKKEFNKKFERANASVVNSIASNAKLMWVDKRAIEEYRPLSVPNARFNCLQQSVLNQNSHRLLWVQPSLPFYRPDGAFANVQNFSKTLVFSAFEMVPRSLATLLSYEAERLISNESEISERSRGVQTSYLSDRRVQALRYQGKEDGNIKSISHNLFALLYPCKALADIYNPVQFLRSNGLVSADEVRRQVKTEVEKLLSTLKTHKPEVDESWYHIAPMLLDIANSSKQPNHLAEWRSLLINGVSEDASEDSVALKNILNTILNFVDERGENTIMGDMPPDLADVLTDCAIGGIGVCALRAFNNAGHAFKVANALRKKFALPEAVSIVDKQGSAYWRNVLKYCVSGNLQAMLTEYHHILCDATGGGDVGEEVCSSMVSSFFLHTASPLVGTIEATNVSIDKIDSPTQEDSFKAEACPPKSHAQSSIKLRTHYAVAFSRDGEDEKSVDRKQDLRNAFNSPLWPFVLITTSIGQEGLDFHNYCRRVVHWNLPSNPIDLEQREGRINRYKCLAIRQSLVAHYGNVVYKEETTDVWKEMFNCASHDLPTKIEAGNSDLYPFWKLGKKQTIDIERLVPLFPLSKDVQKYSRLVQILTLYRLSLGQPNQEAFLNSLLSASLPPESLTPLFISLSPLQRNPIKS